MNRRDYWMMVGLIVLSGFAGGATTTYLVSSTVIAQDSTAPSETLQTRSLQILDSEGRVRIELSAHGGNAPVGDNVTIYGKDGEQIKAPTRVTIDQSRFTRAKPRIRIRNASGETIWKAPQETEAMFVR